MKESCNKAVDIEERDFFFFVCVCIVIKAGNQKGTEKTYEHAKT